MSNMSYCRFENTYGDLLDCLDSLNEAANLDHLNESEKRYAIRLIKLCERFAAECEGMDE